MGVYISVLVGNGIEDLGKQDVAEREVGVGAASVAESGIMLQTV